MSVHHPKSKILRFRCPSCQTSIDFSLTELQRSHSVACSACPKRYLFQDETLLRQLKKFTALCEQIAASEEILGNTSVGVDVGEKQVRIPYKILLTRLNPILDLNLGSQQLSIQFRTEPCKEFSTEIIPEVSYEHS